MEKLLDEISFEGPDLADKRVTIDDAYVNKMLADIVKNEDLSAVHSVKPVFFAVFAVLSFIVVTGCGKSGPPLPPLVRMPAAPANLVAERRGDTVDIEFSVPNAEHRRVAPRQCGTGRRLRDYGAGVDSRRSNPEAWDEGGEHWREGAARPG